MIVKGVDYYFMSEHSVEEKKKLNKKANNVAEKGAALN